MIKDPIVEALHRYRENHAKKFNYDIEAICHDARVRQKNESMVSVVRKAKRAKRNAPTRSA